MWMELWMMRKWKQRELTGITALCLFVLGGAPAFADNVEGPAISVPEAIACVGSECPAKRVDEKGARTVPPESWDAQRRIPGVSAFVNGTGYWGPSRKPGYD